MNAETFCEHFATFADAPNGITKLRELILQLAVQGNLGTQNENDEPSTARSHNGNSIESEPTPSAEELPDAWPFDVPKNWQWLRLRDTPVTLKYGTSVKCEYEGDGVPVLRIPNVVGGQVDLGDLKFGALTDKEQTDLRLEKGDVLLIRSNGSTGIVGRTAVVDENAVGFAYAGYLVRVRFPKQTWFPEFLHLAMISQTTREQIERPIRTTSGVKNINSTEIGRLMLPLPPLAEQRRIVEKVDQLLGLCDELAARQAAQREKRQRLVGATLDRLVSPHTSRHLACRGGLTASAPLDGNTTGAEANEPPGQARWRVMQDDAHRLRTHFDQLFDTPTTIPQLRQTILQLAVQGQLVPQDADDEPADRETCVEDYLTIQNGYAFKSEWFVSNGVRLVRNVNIGHDELRWDDLACVSKDRAQEFARFELNEGDIVIALDRPLISTGLKVARLTKADLPALLLQRVGRPQFKDSRVLPEYFFLWLNSPAFTGSIDPGKSNGVPHIATKDVLRIRFAPPSPETQKRIVTKVTELLSLCDALEAKLTQAESASTQLLSAAVHHLLQN